MSCSYSPVLTDLDKYNDDVILFLNDTTLDIDDEVLCEVIYDDKADTVDYVTFDSSQIDEELDNFDILNYELDYNYDKDNNFLQLSDYEAPEIQVISNLQRLLLILGHPYMYKIMYRGVVSNKNTDLDMPRILLRVIKYSKLKTKILIKLLNKLKTTLDYFVFVDYSAFKISKILHTLPRELSISSSIRKTSPPYFV